MDIFFYLCVFILIVMNSFKNIFDMFLYQKLLRGKGLLYFTHIQAIGHHRGKPRQKLKVGT